MIKKIKKHIDDYLEFDSSKIFNDIDYLVVFGGAIRDIVAGDEDKIKDIDIMCLPKSKRVATEVLLSEGYKLYGLFTPDIYLLYSNIRCIFEPKTFIKGDKIVQLISPTIRNTPVTSIALKNAFFRLLSNVDLSSSGLVYDGEELYESIINATLHCKNKTYRVLTDTEMYQKDRITVRKFNLNEKGWKEISNWNDIGMLRLEKIAAIRSNNLTMNNLRYKIERNEITVR
jgi:hypothetical protein